MLSLLTTTYIGLMAFFMDFYSSNKQFGIYASNDSNDFEVVDYVLRGNVYSENINDTIDIQYYSLFLKPGKSEQVGIGTYRIEPSDQHPLKVVTASDSSQTYVKVRNKSRHSRHLLIGQIAGYESDTSNFQTIEIGGGQTKTVHLPSLVHTFRSQMTESKNMPFPGITLKIRQATSVKK